MPDVRTNAWYPAGMPELHHAGRSRGRGTEHAVQTLIDKACKSHAILERMRWVPQASGDILELGAGTGHNFRFYDAAHAVHVTAVDISPNVLAKAVPHVHTAAVPIELLQVDAQTLPLDRQRS